MSSLFVNPSNLTYIADTIRSKAGISDNLSFPYGFVYAIDGIQAGGGDDGTLDALIGGGSIEIDNSTVTQIRPYAFYLHDSIKTATFRAVTTIGSSAFGSCRSLSSINFPMATIVAQSAFISCYNLITAEIPLLTSTGNSAFFGCNALTEASFPYLVKINADTFRSCRSLTSITFPAAEYIGMQAFEGCSKISVANLPKASVIWSGAFNKCSALSEIHLMGSSVCTLSNSSTFFMTGIGTDKGSIYVPASLVASYQAATNWAYFSTQILAGD